MRASNAPKSTAAQVSDSGMLAQPRSKAAGIHRNLTQIVGPWPPYDVKAVCEHFSLAFGHHALPDDVSGFITRRGECLYAAVNSKHSRGRQRFTLARELGHFLVHGQCLQKLAEMEEVNWSYCQERQARAFAAELLMPQAWIMEYKDYLTKGQMAKECLVSRQAMGIRLEELGVCASRGRASAEQLAAWREKAFGFIKGG